MNRFSQAECISARTSRWYTDAMKATAQSGQVGIAVLLIMVVLSTIGITLATRTSQDIQSTRQSREATQTFSAAESALEEVLSQGQTYLDSNPSGEYTKVENTTVNYTVDQSEELSTELLQGAVAQIDVTGSSNGDVVRLEWSLITDCAQSPASLAVTVVNATAPSSARSYSYSICERDDGFTLINTQGTTFMRQVDLTLQTGDRYIRITPIYNDTRLLVNGVGWTLPTQEYTVNSVARNDLGRETKAIEVQRTIDYTPSIFDFALVSGTSILK